MMEEGCVHCADVSLFAKYVLAGNRMAAPPGMPDKARQLQLECWSLEPKSRPSFADVYDRLFPLVLEAQEGEAAAMSSDM
jgi:hypothetical protein